jgi:hypothetical protein
MRRAACLALTACLLALAFAPQARAVTTVDRVLQAWQTDPVYVDPDAEHALSTADADRVRRAITDDRAGPMYVAVVPASAADEAGGSPDGVLSDLANGLRRDGTYAVVVGNSFRAGSTNLGGVRAAADDAFSAHKGDGVTAVLIDFADRVGKLRAGDDTGSGDGGNGPGSAGTILVLAAIGLGGGALLLSRRRRRAREAEELDEVKDNARDDLVSLGEDIRALEVDVGLAGASAEARDDYARAVDAYERANQVWERARRPEDLEPVAAALEEGRWAMASAKARLEGRQPPERRPPCFFDPRHGPSSREVEWAPPGGRVARRPVARTAAWCTAIGRRSTGSSPPSARTAPEPWRMRAPSPRTPWRRSAPAAPKRGVRRTAS